MLDCYQDRIITIIHIIWQGRYRRDSRKSERTIAYHDTFVHSHNYDKTVEIDRVDFGVDSAPFSVQNTHSTAPPKPIEHVKYWVGLFTFLASAKLIIGGVHWCQSNGCSQQRSAYTILGPEISWKVAQSTVFNYTLVCAKKNVVYTSGQIKRVKCNGK